MKDLTYKLIYTPSNESYYLLEESDINFVCSDGKIHIRLRDYGDKEEVISGFINKLTYLVTYLVNYMVNSNPERYNSTDKLLESSTEIINNSIGRFIGLTIHNDNYKGIKISKNYRKVKHYDILGGIPTELCPYSNGKDKCSIDLFLRTFGINLHDYLFNDAYEVVICKNDKKSNYNKFLNKQSRGKKVVDNKRIALW